MKPKSEKYINLFTDFGFKRIFGELIGKEFLIDFLNELLFRDNKSKRIKDLRYLPKERLGDVESSRKIIYDLYCENELGEKFLVEVQKVNQSYFKERSIYYSSRLISEQGKKGYWNYNLKSVYTVCILDFNFDNSKEYYHEIYLYDVKKSKIFYNKLRYIYLELSKYDKSLENLETRFDKWLYIFKGLNKLEVMPKELEDKTFEKLFDTAEVSKLSKEDYRRYELSLKDYRDFVNTTNFTKSQLEMAQKQIEKAQKQSEEAQKQVIEAKKVQKQAAEDVLKAKEKAQKQVIEAKEKAQKQVIEAKEEAQKQVLEAKEAKEKAQKQAAEDVLKAKEEAAQNNKLDMIKKLLSSGISLDTICKSLDIDKKDLKEIIN